MQRRSLRKFAPAAVDSEVVETILNAAMTAPSSKNTRSTRIAVSGNPAHAAAVAAMRSTGTSFVAAAPLLFFVMGDPEASPMWMVNASIAATVLQLAAEGVGLGSCWVQVEGRPHDEAMPEGSTAQEWLHEHIEGLPNLPILCVIAAGYHPEPPHERKQVDNSDKIFRL